jgi:hypothetical protein
MVTPTPPKPAVTGLNLDMVCRYEAIGEKDVVINLYNQQGVLMGTIPVSDWNEVQKQAGPIIPDTSGAVLLQLTLNDKNEVEATRWPILGWRTGMKYASPVPVTFIELEELHCHWLIELSDAYGPVRWRGFGKDHGAYRTVDEVAKVIGALLSRTVKKSA